MDIYFGHGVVHRRGVNALPGEGFDQFLQVEGDNFDFNRAITDHSILRWGGRIRYREDKEFWDYNTSIGYRQWFDDHEDYPSAIEYFASVSGRDQPEVFETNYRLGVLFRRQFFRDFLFYEIEPSVSWRRDNYDEERERVFGVVLRLEIMLDDDLIRGR